MYTEELKLLDEQIEYLKTRITKIKEIKVRSEKNDPCDDILNNGIKLTQAVKDRETELILLKNIYVIVSSTHLKASDNNNYITYLEKRCKDANFAPYDDRVSKESNDVFEWDFNTIAIAEKWLKEHNTEINVCTCARSNSWYNRIHDAQKCKMYDKIVRYQKITE